MKNKLFLFLLTISISCSAWAIDKQILTDTLTAFVKQHAYTE